MTSHTKANSTCLDTANNDQTWSLQVIYVFLKTWKIESSRESQVRFFLINRSWHKMPFMDELWFLNSISPIFNLSHPLPHMLLSVWEWKQTLASFSALFISAGSLLSRVLVLLVFSHKGSDYSAETACTIIPTCIFYFCIGSCYLQSLSDFLIFEPNDLKGAILCSSISPRPGTKVNVTILAAFMVF